MTATATHRPAPEASAGDAVVSALTDRWQRAESAGTASWTLLRASWPSVVAAAIPLIRTAVSAQGRLVVLSEPSRFGAGLVGASQLLAGWAEALRDRGKLHDGVVRSLARFEEGAAIGSDETPSMGWPDLTDRFVQAIEALGSAAPSALLLLGLGSASHEVRTLLAAAAERLVEHPLPGLDPRQRGATSPPWFVELVLGGEPAVAPAAPAVPLDGLGTELVRQFLAREDVIRRITSATGAEPAALGEVLAAMPDSFDDLVARRVRSRTRDEQAILRVLAMFGRPLSPDAALRAAGGARSEALRALLADGLVLRSHAAGGPRVELARSVQRVSVLATIPSDDARALAGVRAQWLAALQEAGERVDGEELVEAHLEAGNAGGAIAAALRAADALQIGHSLDRARRCLCLVLDVASGSPREAEVRERLLTVLLDLGDHGGALAQCDRLEAAAPGRWSVERLRILVEASRFGEAVELARTLQATQLEPEAELLIEALRLEALHGLGLHADVAATASDAAATPTVIGTIRADNVRAKSLLFLGRYDEALARFEANALRAREAGLATEELRALFNQGTVWLQQREFDAARAVFERVLAYGAGGGGELATALAHLNLGVLHQRMRHYDEALTHHLAAVEQFRRLGSDLQLGVAAMNLGTLYEDLGDVQRASAALRMAGEVLRRHGSQYFVGRVEYATARVALLTRDWAAALRHAEQADRAFEHSGTRQFISRVAAVRARALMESTEVAACQQAIVEGRAALPDAVEPEVALELNAVEFESLARGGRTEGIAGLAEVARAFEALGLHAREVSVLAVRERSKKPAVSREALSALLARWDSLGATLSPPLRRLWEAHPERQMLIAAVRATGEKPPVLAAPTQRDLEGWRRRYPRIVGSHPRMCQLFRLLDRVAPTESSALVFGESGTGKELVAEAIHRNSARAAGPFVKVNCAAFVETLLLSELFGHERGAFTGATQRKKGRFELADGGTLFLDEIGDISPTTQVALLRVLQERTFERVGGTESVTSDVRLICATNRNLEAMVRSGQFRQDLYYRLKGVIIELPTLRARRSDIPALVRQALAGMGASAEARSFSADAMHRLVSYSWPGNVRELENLVRAVAVLADRPVIDRAQLALFDDYFADGSFAEDVEPAAIDNGPADAEPTSEPPAIVPPPGLGAASLTSLGLDEARERLEFELISQALTAEAGNIAAAARRLQVKRPRLSQLISAHPGLTELRERLLAGNDSTRDDTEATHESAS